MKLLLDENLSHRLVALLEPIFPGTRHVRDCGLERVPDQDIWDFAKESGFVIVTQDADFDDLVALRGWPPKVIRIAIGNCPTRRIVMLLENGLERLHSFYDDDSRGCLVLHSGTKAPDPRS